MKKPYAEIIVDIELDKLDHPFTYRIPERLKELVVPGSCVKIPFGRGERVILGYVTDLKDKTELPEESLKEILDISAGEETAESRLILLAAWMSHRYGSTMIRALKTVIPVRKKVGAVTEKTVSLAEGIDAEAEASRLAAKRSVARERVVRALMAGPKSMRDLKAAARVPLSVVEQLSREGIVEIAATDVLRRVAEKEEPCAPDTLTSEQEAALLEIRGEWDKEKGEGRPVLLEGVTGSGKTVVYTELIADALEAGKQAIVLIPEIALTRQTVRRFVRRFGDRVSFLHSRLSEGERYDQMKAARSGEISVMVGPRSALFTPFPALGLVIIDEEHEDSYHSELMPRYHAGEVARKRAEIEGAHVLFGSATPSLTSARHAETGQYLRVLLRSRFGGSVLPASSIVDMREELKKGNRSMLSDLLKEKIRDRLSRGEQVMLFLNRRGYTGQVTCRSCGHVIKCPHCDVSMTLHRNGRLICHYCGHETASIRICPDCGSSQIGGITVGTEQAEEQIAMAFPDARILRMDYDTTRGKEGHGVILKAFGDGEADILLGTQMIVKGHDFPKVTLVGVLLADLSLNESDYRSSERTYQLIAQAAGRAGRGASPGEVVIQTYEPEHFAILSAARGDYEAFYKEEMAYRRLLGYPPCGGMLAILCSSPDEAQLDLATAFLRKYIDRIDPAGALKAIGPAPQAVGRVKDQYRQVIYLRNDHPTQLIRAKDLLEEYIAANSGFAAIHIMFDFQ